MKNRKTELDVDFIGGQETLTREEEKALSEYFKERKVSSKQRLSVLKSSRRSKTTI